MWTASDKQGVNLAFIRFKGVVDGKLQTARAFDHPFAGADHFNPIGAWVAQLSGCFGEDIGRSDNVQQLHAGEGQEGYAHDVCPRRIIG
ncbi:hypothetical protein D3C87_1352610 [compost metagenome]